MSHFDGVMFPTISPLKYDEDLFIEVPNKTQLHFNGLLGPITSWSESIERKEFKDSFLIVPNRTQGHFVGMGPDTFLIKGSKTQ